MSNPVFPVSPQLAQRALINAEKYKSMYKESIENPDKFWAEQAERLTWIKKWNKVSKNSFQKPVHIEWFSGGQLNVSVNCLDRHLEKNGDKVAFIWEPDNPQTPSQKVTYRKLHQEVCRFANVLKKAGVRKGDVVTIYMPMILEATYAMLACTRIGAVHSVVFGGFSPDAIADRMSDAKSRFTVTADAGYRASKIIPLKENVDKAVLKAPCMETVIVVQYAKNSVEMKKGRDFWYHELADEVDTQCAPEVMDSEDPLFMLYTSGSTGKPKGVQHTTAGYLLYASLTHQYVFDYHPDDIYFCTADVGWVTGHSYIVYGPLANAATGVIFEGVPNYPTPSRLWQIVDKHQVNIVYTSPTAIRALMAEGDRFVTQTSRQSLRLLGSVGEPINPEAWQWFHKVVGDNRCPIVDTWWQTETGGIMITPLPGATDLKPGSATLPFFGVKPVLLTNEGKVIDGAGEGVLAIDRSWPGQARTVFGDHKRFEETYFSTYPGYYFTGDGCRRDEDGYYWITGRVDDVINVSGHRLGTAEIESALVSHPKVAEAAVVGYPHNIKGQGIYAYVTLKVGELATDELRKEILKHVAQEISPIARPDLLQWAPRLPKTRSGKIMRRILRKIAENQVDALGDTSTLADPTVVQELVDNRMNH